MEVIQERFQREEHYLAFLLEKELLNLGYNGEVTQELRARAQRERNRIRAKVSNIEKFVLTHTDPQYDLSAHLKEEVQILRQTYIDHFLDVQRKKLQTLPPLSRRLLLEFE